MKRKSTGRNTAVYDFDEGDAEPYITKLAKKKAFLEVFSKGMHLSRNRSSDEMDSCDEVTGRLVKSLRIESSHAKEMNGSQSSSVSDVIESDNSDSESNHGRKVLATEFGGALLSFEILEDEDVDAVVSRKIVMHGEELRLSHWKYSSPELTFTVDTIELKAEDLDVVNLPLSVITNFRSGSNEEELPFVELELTEHGAQLLQQYLGLSDKCSLPYKILSTFSDGAALVEKIKQITSLSDSYKLIWRPDKDYVMQKCVQSTLQDRERFDYAEDKQLLGDDILQRSRSRLNDWYDLIYPTQDDRDAVTVTKYDYSLLNPDQFLSDTIIDFYIKYLQRHIPEADKHRFYFYNSFFFRKLTEDNKSSKNESTKSAYERVKRWTAGINILDKDFLFIPIMQNSHWSLVIICHPKYLSAGYSAASDFKAPLILHLDSLEGCHTCIEEPIQSYLLEAWREKDWHKKESESLDTVKFVALKVPQQTNYSDCGLFLLHYVELFIKEVLEKAISEPVLEDYPFHEWFNPIDAFRKRSCIQALIEDLRPKMSFEEHPRPKLFTDTQGFELSGIVQRHVSFGLGVCYAKTTDNLYGNLSDQACGAICSHHDHHHENDVPISARLTSGHEHVELEDFLEVIGERRHSGHCGQHSAFDELGNLSSPQQGAAVNPVPALLMPSCTDVECNHLAQSHSYVSLDDGLECDTSDINIVEFNVPVMEENDQPDQGTAEVVDVSGKSNVVEESLTSSSSNPFVNSRINARGGVAFCCHYGDAQIFDKPVASAAKSSMEETSYEQVLHSGHSGSGGSIRRAESPLKLNNPAYDGSTDVAHNSKEDSVGYPVVWLQGLEGVTTVDENSLTQQHIADTNDSTQRAVVDGSLEVGMEVSHMEGSKLQMVVEFASANKFEGSRVEKEEETSAPSSKEEGFWASKLQSTKEEIGAVIEAGSEGLHLSSTDKELKSKVVNRLGNSKSLHASQKNRKLNVGSPARRITRSLAKNPDQVKGSE